MAGEAVGLDSLSEQVRAQLGGIGISTVEELLSRELAELLEAVKYEEQATDELWTLCGLPRPQDEQELLALLFASGIARKALAGASYSTTHYTSSEKIMRLQEEVSEQIKRGVLHERAGMNWTVLQTLNQMLRPPAQTLPELLQRLQYSARASVFDALRKLSAAVEVPSLEKDLELLFGQLDDRQAVVIRQRLEVGHRRTLEEIGVHLRVTRERVRQIESQAITELSKAYRELPLLRIRTAMLLIRQDQVFALDDMRSLFQERSLATSDSAVRDLLVVWRALSLGDSGVFEALVNWKAIDPEDYGFPEEILSTAKTGLSPRQQGFAEDVARVARRTVSRVGVVTTAQIIEVLDHGEPPDEDDVAAILVKAGFQSVLPGRWTTDGEEYSIPREVMSKMLAVCGPLDLRQLRRGLLRHQRKLGFPVPPVSVLGRVLAHQNIFELSEDGICSLKTPGLHAPNLGLAEQIWVETARAYGPVVHSYNIVRAFKEKGLQKVTAYRLMMGSPLVEKVGRQLFSLPGTEITPVDSEALQQKAIRGGSVIGLPAPETRQTAEEPTSIDEESLRDVSPGAPQPYSGEPLWGRLRYETAENRLSMELPETTWQGEVNVRLSWDGREFDLPSTYSPSEDTTTTGVASLPVREPLWEVEGLLSAGQGLRVARFPRPPLQHGLVFRASGGETLGRWRTGEEHYVVLPTERLSEEYVTEIFEEWHSLGQPEGWEDFTVLWVRTRDPLGLGGAQGPRVGAAALIDAFGRATRALGLPDFDFLWRPRPRMVGGRSLGVSKGREKFSAALPPYLEVNGLWDSALEVSISRWIPGSTEFVKMAILRVPPPKEASCLIEIWGADERPQEGRYRVEVGKQRIEFEISNPAPLSGLKRPAVDLALREDGTSSGETFLTRGDLERGTLVGQAWPGARLRFTATSGVWSRTVGVTADEEGAWRARWRDLGLSETPEGLLKLELSWRGLISSALFVADEPFIAEGDIELSSRARGQESSLVLSGMVSNTGGAQLARAILLGAQPWAGQVWARELRLDERGAFETEFRDVDGEVRWLVMLPGDKVSVARSGQRPWFVQGKVEDAPLESYPLEDLRGEHQDGWEELKNELRGAPLPAALERLLDLSDLGAVLEKVRETPVGRSRWMAVDEPDDLRRLLSWRQFGLRTPVAVFSSAAPVTATTPSDTLPPLLTVGLEGLTEALSRGTGELPLECVTHDGERRRVKASLALGETRGEGGYRLHAGELLYGCPRCGLISPPGEFWNHRPPGQDMSPCSEGRRSLQLISEGRTKPVALVLRVDTEEMGRCIRELVRRVVSGNEDDVPDHVASWLDLLQEAYFEAGEEQVPERWLDAVYSLYERLRLVREGGGSEVELADLGRLARHHEAGLDAISRWHKSEVG